MEENTEAKTNVVVEETTEKTQEAEVKEEQPKLYSEEEAQKMISSAIARKFKNVPSKEELEAFNTWKESQKTEEQKATEKEQELNKINQENTTLRQAMSVMKKGVDDEYVEFVQYEVAKMDGDFEENLGKYLESHSKFTKGANSNANVSTGSPISKVNKQESGVGSILRAKYPNLYN